MKELKNPKVYLKVTQVSKGELLQVLEKENVIETTYLSDYCIAVTKEGKVFKCSKEGTKQLGTSPLYQNDQTQIKLIESGFNHCIIVKESNNVYGYTTNGNDYKVLGSDQVTSDKHSIEIVPSHQMNKIVKENNSEVTHVCCSVYSSFIVLNNTDIYFSGSLKSLSKDAFTKIEIENKENCKIKRITCGYHHVVVIYEDGDVYGQGGNDYGQCVVSGKNRDVNLFEKSDLEKYFKKKKIVDAIAFRKSHMTLFISSENDFYIYGYIGFNETSTFKDHTKITTNAQGYSIYKLELQNLPQFNNFNNINSNINFKEWEMYGAYTSLFIVNNRKGKVWAVGRTSVTDNNGFTLIDGLELNEKEKVIKISSGTNDFGILVAEGYFKGEEEMKKKLLIYCNACFEKENLFLFDISIN
ncbi:hypothetical protein ABK040_008149 [Willaertia magna]